MRKLTPKTLLSGPIHHPCLVQVRRPFPSLTPPPLLPPVRALSQKKPLQPANRALHKSRNKNFFKPCEEAVEKNAPYLSLVMGWF